jgi:hypothetical protein
MFQPSLNCRAFVFHCESSTMIAAFARAENLRRAQPAISLDEANSVDTHNEVKANRQQSDFKTVIVLILSMWIVQTLLQSAA